jgi:hypothetical protein
VADIGKEARTSDASDPARQPPIATRRRATAASLTAQLEEPFRLLGVRA